MPSKRKEDPGNANDDAESVNSSSNSSVSNKNVTTKRSRNSLNSKTAAAVQHDIQLEQAQEIYDYIKTYRSENDHRVLCENFIRLPTKRANLEYFTTIKQPIDMIKIQQRFKLEEYKIFKQFDNDMILLFSNARRFYKKNSAEYKDATALYEIYEAEKKKRKLPESGLIDDDESAQKSELENAGEEEVEEEDEEVEEDEDDEEENEEEEDEPADESNQDKMDTEEDSKPKLDEITGSGRKRGRPPNTQRVVTPIKLKLETSATISTDRSLRNKSTNSTTPATRAPSGLQQYLYDYFDLICSYQDQTQRYLANIFYVLPSAKEYPDYYQIIKKPIDLKQVAKKILSSTYKTLKQMENDLILMMDNARRYNDPKSVIYKDATKLKKVAKDRCKELITFKEKNKPYPSNKSNEKKHKLLMEIADNDGTEEIQPPSEDSNDNEEEEPEEDGDADDDEDDEEDEDDDEETETKTSKTINLEKGDDSDDESETGAKQSSRGKRTSNTNQLSAMWDLYDYIKDTAGTNIDPFVKLPSKRFYPDYYEEIKTPIALNIIKKNLDKRSYKTIRELVADFELMFNNAMLYNLEESVIYKNAKNLLESLKQKSGELSLNISATISVPAGPHSGSKRTSTGTPNATTPVSKSLKTRSAALVSPSVKTSIENNCKRLIQLILAYTADSDDRLSSAFLSWNNISAQASPEMLERVKDPIDLNTILKRIESSAYKSETEMINDCINFLLDVKLLFSSNEFSKMHTDAMKLLIYVINLQNTGLSPSEQQIIPKFTDLKEKLIYFYNYINDYQIEKRELAFAFRHLPTKSEYPEYYNIIKKPIDMTKIWNKINYQSKDHTVNSSHSYSSLDDMCMDFVQMFENACIFNEPSSTIYKDALNLQRALLFKRDEIFNYEAKINSAKQQPPGSELLVYDNLPFDFVSNQINELISELFEACMQHQDAEGRTLKDSFVYFYYLYASLPADKQLDQPLVTFELIKERIKNKIYKRIDVFQDDMFHVFNQTRIFSYLSASNDQPNGLRLHRYSQLYKDSYDLQRYFIQKRDELCRNGDLVQTGALNYKATALDTYMASLSVTGSSNWSTLDEYEALSVERRYKPLEDELEKSADSASDNLGNFYLINKAYLKDKIVNKELLDGFNLKDDDNFVVCVLNSNQNKYILQIYLKKTDLEDSTRFEILKMTHKFYDNEVLKSDLYALVQIDDLNILKPCVVMGMKDYLVNEPEISKEPLFICESIYSSVYDYTRKITNKKWFPLMFIQSTASTNSQIAPVLSVNKRSAPITVNRSYIDELAVKNLVDSTNQKINEISKTKELFRLNFISIQYDSLPAALQAHAASSSKEKDADEIVDPSHNQSSIEDDVELMKTAKYYEQLLFKQDELYKLGDYVYVKYQQLLPGTVTPADSDKLPIIIRIDRLWSTTDPTNGTVNYYLKGPVFLRPREVFHEPTRLFYKNEVIKEVARELTVSLDQIVLSNNGTGKKKCVVMNNKKFVSSRLTEIDERDIYICESKYSIQNKTFRKFTKGLRKFELSVKCNEDEIYFLRREIQLRKYPSPILLSLKINYDETAEESQGGSGDDGNVAAGSADLAGSNSNNDDYWSEIIRDDDNSSQSYTNENSNMEMSAMLGSPHSKGKLTVAKLTELAATGKKIRVKRLKKTAYNIFSKEFRKSLRDTRSSLSFVDMSKEVGNRWKALSDKERAAYEEKAKIQSLKMAEAKKAQEAEEQAAQQLQQQQQLAQQQASAPQHSNHINHILAAQAAQQQQQHHQQVQPQQVLNPIPINSNGPMYITSSGLIQTANQVNAGTPILIQQGTNGAMINKSPMIIYQNQMQPQQANNYVNVQQINQTHYDNQYQQVQQQQQPQQPPQPVKQEGPKQVLHKEAYVKYIANLRKQQQIHQSGSTNPYLHSAAVNHSHWYNGLDIRQSRIKESKVMPPPSAWIENCASNDVLQHLLSLRYYLLNDAINIDREPHLSALSSSSSSAVEPTIEQSASPTPPVVELMETNTTEENVK